MFGSLLRFELRGHLRRPTTWLYFTILFLLAFGILSSDVIQVAGGLGKVKKNSPFALARAYVALLTIGQIITSALVGTAVLKDFDQRVHELLFTTRITRLGYLASKFLAALAAMVLVYFAIPLGALLGSVMPWIDQETLLPIQLWFYLQPMFTLVLPTVLFVSALFFAVGAVTRNQFAIYTTGILLLVGISIGDDLIRTLDRDQLANLLDPFGFRTVDLMTRYWTVAEKNTQTLPFASFLLTNRVVWAIVSLVLVAVAFRFVKLEKDSPRRRRRKTTATSSEAQAAIAPRHVHITPQFGATGAWASWRSITWFHTKSLLRSVPFLAIAAIGLINVIMSCWYADQSYDTRTWALSWIMSEAANGGAGLFMIVLLTFYAGELVWRERQVSLDQVLDASPVQSVSVFLGKFSAMTLVLAAFAACTVLGGVIVQLAKGYPLIDVRVYGIETFVVNFPSWLSLVALAFLVQTLVPKKPIGHVVMIVFYVATLVYSSIGIDHSLLEFGGTPAYRYSDMNGVGPYPRAWLPTHGYWLSISALLLVAAYLSWVRGTDTSIRWKEMARRFSTRVRLTAAGSVLSAGALGGFVFYNTNVVNSYESKKAGEKRQVAYEQAYKKFEKTPQPKVVGVRMSVDFSPAQLQASAAGTITMVNRHAVAVDTIYLEGRGDGTLHVAYDSLTFDRPSRTVIADSVNGVFVFALGAPLAAGDSLRLRYAVHYAHRGFPNGEPGHEISANGSFLNRDAFPTIGYAGNGEMGDDELRRKYKLPVKERTPRLDDSSRYSEQVFSPGSDYITFEATVSTSPDQIAMAPGYLKKEWTSNGRRYFTYAMNAPIPDFYSFLSARYTVTTSSWNGVPIEILHHGAHRFNVERMIAASKASLAYYTEQFGAYQHQQIRILEFPRYASFAQSFPNTVPYSERIGFITKIDSTSEEDVDYPYFVTAHEIAHQWFPYQRMPANVQGAQMLSESLAEYSALAVLEQRYGPEKLQKFLRFELDQYLRGRGTERKKEMPLMLVENQGYIQYQKGSLAFFALRDLIGASALHGALKAYLDEARLGGPPYATTHDLMRKLHAATPDSLQYAVHDLFETITLWDFKSDSATATEQADGTWKVRLTASALKLRADTLGAETPIAIGDYVDIGVFGEKAAGARLGKPLSVRKVKLTKPTEVFEFIVKEKPLRAGVDPYNRLIDRNPGDNTRDVSGA